MEREGKRKGENEEEREEDIVVLKTFLQYIACFLHKNNSGAALLSSKVCARTTSGYHNTDVTVICFSSILKTLQLY